MSETQPQSTARRPATKSSGLRSWVKPAAIALGIVFLGLATLAGIVRYVYLPWKYPYGWSHSCDKVLELCLTNYADAHGGCYPAGEETPEASLSLLAAPPYECPADVLRGKTVSREVVEQILGSGEPLGPETCGWHYVEGLCQNDDPEL